MKEGSVTVRGVHILRLERGEDVFATLADFCSRNGIQNAVFSAIGAIKNVKIGFYDLAAKQYGSKIYEAEHEVASMTGNVALVDQKPFLHIHAVLSGIAPGEENQCIGGHVFEAVVAVTLEVHMTVFEESISRTLDNEVGLKLLECDVDR